MNILIMDNLKEVPYNQIPYGCVFAYNNLQDYTSLEARDICMAITPCYRRDVNTMGGFAVGEEFNTISLTTGELFYIEPKEPVVLIPESWITLLIERN